MNSNTVKINLTGKSHSYEVQVSHNLLSDCGSWAKRNLPENTKKVVIISNQKVFGLYGDSVQQSLVDEGFEVSVWLMQDGEEYKNFDSLQEALKFFSSSNLKRSDAIIALGGGVVGDLAGFASSIYLRGIKFLQIPTTLLAMIDSSVGGKTAVNTEFGKNLVGTFYQPNGVLVDVETLKTLEYRELIAGFCEAIKQGAIADQKLFDNIYSFLKRYDLTEFSILIEDQIFIENLENLIARQIKFKADVVMQDEQESVDRKDGKSRKVLNFGHTTAHALEKITNYKYFKHGEAVGIGILVAAQISKRLAISDKKSINLLNDVVSCVGKLPDTTDIDIEKLFELFAFDKKSIGNSVQWILLESIGKPKIIESKDIPNSIIKDSLQNILKS